MFPAGVKRTEDGDQDINLRVFEKAEPTGWRQGRR